MVNQFYFYCVDADFGPFFLKFASYFPYNARLCLNGNEYAKRRAAKAGVEFTPLDNGFAGCADPARLQTICDRLSPAKIDALLRKWLRLLSHPFSRADRAAGYRYDVSVLQAEFSLTQTLHRPVSGRVLFEEVIAENLDLGRPDKIGLVSDRRIRTRGARPTPGRFRTRVLSAGVTPSLHVDYKNPRVKQYHKLDRALRTETTINDSRDFGIGKRLCNLPALREVGFSANRRLLDVERLTCDPAIGADAFTALSSPVLASTQRAAALPFHAARTQALLAALVFFRLRLHGLIDRVPHSHRYRVTDGGLRTALCLTRVHARLVRPGLGCLLDEADIPSPVRRQLDRFGAAVDDFARQNRLIA